MGLRNKEKEEQKSFKVPKAKNKLWKKDKSLNKLNKKHIDSEAQLEDIEVDQVIPINQIVTNSDEPQKKGKGIIKK